MDQIDAVQVVQGLQQLVDDVFAMDVLQNPSSDHRMQVRLCGPVVQNETNTMEKHQMITMLRSPIWSNVK